MSDEEWERFAVEVLRHFGFKIETVPSFGPDGGKDFIASDNKNICLVSCKHYIKSGKHVGIDDEINISDRLLQFKATCFIGFYSTTITSGLQARLNGICQNGNYAYTIFEPTNIINAMQDMDTKTLQSFGLYPGKYYMNVTADNYKPLKCMICGKDILTDQNIPNSLVGLAKLKDGKYDYAYGCKPCFQAVDLLYTHLELEQALHVGVLQDWENMVDEWIDNLELCEKFYKHRTKFLNRVRQRQLPQTEGTWYGIY